MVFSIGLYVVAIECNDVEGNETNSSFVLKEVVEDETIDPSSPNESNNVRKLLSFAPIVLEVAEMGGSPAEGFTRSSKKKNQNKLGNNYGELYLNNDSSTSLNYNQNTQGSIYSNNNGSSLSLRRTHSPSKQSIRSFKSSNTNRQQQNKQQQQQQQSSKPPLFICEPFVKIALVKGSYKTIVQQPKYVDYHEWLALNTFELFNHLNKFYGVIAEYVTPDRYPIMTADPKTEYVWLLPNNKAVSLPAGQYIDHALTWISNKINDQTIFPTKSGMAFPPSFLREIKGIYIQMFRIIAHIFHNHFEKFVHLSLEAHWNSYFAHFISFVTEFDLIAKNELEPLSMLIENLEAQGKIIPVGKDS
ncbi:hypothetical protein OGAPHI_006391 [Ogataea philodendri]|uniref:CBK1 kinase activator protein MOB2 n=1 Tax=Ogataea philodendri TaxID=1378263 RepID=A0A9P8NX71_9ASCO|nr:uncharacterized protein OGAPHI_006391 [Ogataea philodendri]KAH3661543.1 hypothetical protein OGAPHI_006391 [Ogataea philodendri]